MKSLHKHQQATCVAARKIFGRFFKTSCTFLWSGVAGLIFLFATARAGQISLAWFPSATPGVIGYNIYYGLESGIYTDKVSVGLVTNTTITGLIAGATYYFVATAYTSTGLESPFSNEISYVVPSAADVQLQIAAARQFVLTISGLTNHVYEIQATQDFKAWTNIGSAFIGGDGSLNFTDADAGNFSQRFYRVQDQQP
jgi:hypothetical protein